MKKVLLLLIVAGFLCSLNAQAQEEEKKFGVSFSGFVKNDFFWDSRQVVAAREGHFLLWPAAELLDADGNDINAQPGFNFLSVQSRLSANITGPDAFGARTSGLIEGDFFAQNDANINLFRLRHAFVKLNWTNTELITGQYWNPLFVTGCFPGTVSFNTGTPIQSFARNTQIRVTQKLGNLSIVVAALGQRDFSTRGPDPSNNAATLISSNYLRNSSIPDMHFQLHYNSKNDETGNALLAGAGAAYKIVTPRIVSTGTAGTYSVDEKMGGLTAIAFSQLTLRPVTIKIQGRYGENIADLLSVSGFAVKEIVNTNTGEQTYTPLKNASFWGEIHTNGKKFQAGIFGGITKGLGTKEAMSANTNPVYGLGTNIETLIRVSPRVMFISNKTKIGCEVEYTSAAYGRNYDNYYVPAATTEVSNLRLLMSVIYAF